MPGSLALDHTAGSSVAPCTRQPFGRLVQLASRSTAELAVRQGSCTAGTAVVAFAFAVPVVVVPVVVVSVGYTCSGSLGG